MRRVRGLVAVPAMAALFVLAAAQWGVASTGPKWSIPELTDFSEVVVTGRVTGIATKWDPSITSIYTYVTIDVDDVLKGAVEPRQIVLKQAGGVVGELGLHVSGQATFDLGEEVLLFAEVRPRDLTLYSTALWQGKWTLEFDARTGQRMAVQRDPEMRSGNSETDRRQVSEMRLAIAERVVSDWWPESFHVIPHEALAVSTGSQPFVFFDSPTRWMSTPVIVDIQAGGQPGLAGGGLGQLQNVFTQWNGVANFVYAPRSTSAASRCGTVFGNSGILTFVANDPCGEISNSGGVIAVAFSWFTTAVATTINGVNFRRTLEVTIISNDSASAQQFVTNTPCYQQVMLHESGHALGLGHTSVPGAIMVASVAFSQCSTGASNLQPDDTAGARAIYPFSGGTTVPGSKPTNVQVVVQGTSTLTVTYNAVIADVAVAPSAATSYRLDFRQTVGGPVLASVPTTATSVTVGIPAGTTGTFNVTVTPLNGAGAGPASDPVTFTIGSTGCTSAPPTPTGVSGGVANGTATVRWNASPGATSYIVQAGGAPGGAEMFNANVGSTTTVSASGLPPGFRAFVRIFAVNACGQSAPTAAFLVQ